MNTLLNNRTKNTFRIFTFLAVTAIFSGCTKDNSPSSTTDQSYEVTISGSTFSPSSITIPVNTTLKWTNNDSYAHTVTSDASNFDSGNLNSGAAFNFKFTSTGTFAYHCAYHSNMHGTVIVQ